MDLHSFCTLPYELRIMIWECLMEPRVVLIKTLGQRVYSSRTIPVIFHVCHESRQIGLRNYSGPSYDTSPDNLCLDEPSLEVKYRPTTLYFNPTIDALYLSSQFRMLFLMDRAISKLKLTTLNIEYHTFCQFLHSTVPARRNELPVKVCLGILLKLQTISLVLEDLSKGDSDIELVDIAEEPLARRLGSHFRSAEALAALCRGDSSPKVVFKSMVSRKSCVQTK